MKLNELLTGLDEKMEALLDALSEEERSGEEMSFGEHANKPDDMEDVLASFSRLSTDNYTDVYVLENQENNGSMEFTKANRKESMPVVEDSENQPGWMDEIIKRCTDIMQAVNECAYIDGNITDFKVGADFNEVVFFTDLHSCHFLSMDYLSCRDYMSVSVTNLLEGFIQDELVEEMQNINIFFPDGCSLVLYLDVQGEKTEYPDDYRVGVQFISPLDRTARELMQETFPVKDYFSMNMVEKMDVILENSATAELCEMDRDIIQCAFDGYFSDFHYTEDHVEITEKEFFQMEQDDLYNNDICDD